MSQNTWNRKFFEDIYFSKNYKGRGVDPKYQKIIQKNKGTLDFRISQFEYSMNNLSNFLREQDPFLYDELQLDNESYNQENRRIPLCELKMFEAVNEDLKLPIEPTRNKDTLLNKIDKIFGISSSASKIKTDEMPYITFFSDVYAAWGETYKQNGKKLETRDLFFDDLLDRLYAMTTWSNDYKEDLEDEVEHLIDNVGFLGCSKLFENTLLVSSLESFLNEDMKEENGSLNLSSSNLKGVLSPNRLKSHPIGLFILEELKILNDDNLREICSNVEKDNLFTVFASRDENENFVDFMNENIKVYATEYKQSSTYLNEGVISLREEYKNTKQTNKLVKDILEVDKTTIKEREM